MQDDGEESHVPGLEDAFDARRALVAGVGGGGDVVGALPTAMLLERHGVDVTLGGVAWERVPHDDRVGPRSMDEIRGLERLHEGIGLATGDTATEDGLVFTESRVAEHLDEPVALLDVTAGAGGVAAAFEAFCEVRDVNLVVGVDAGGDAVAHGDEPGIESPIADGILVAALDALDVPSMLGVFGAGSDGELTRAELDAAFQRIAEDGGLLGAWGLTPRTVEAMESLIAAVGTTEASKLPVEAASGAMGRRGIRDGERTVEMTPLSTATVYVDPATVAAQSRIVELVRDHGDVDAVHRALRDAGYRTEIEAESARLDGGAGLQD